MGGVKSRLKTNSAQVKLKLRLNLAILPSLSFYYTTILYYTILLSWVGEWVCGKVGGWVYRKVKDNDHLSPAEADVGAELGKNPKC